MSPRSLVLLLLTFAAVGHASPSVSPLRLGDLDLGPPASETRVRAEGNFLYVGRAEGGRGPDFEIFDVKVAGAPERTGELRIEGGVHDLAVRHPYALLLAGRGSLRLLVVDVLDRASPRVRVSIPLRAAGSARDYRLHWVGDLLFVALPDGRHGQLLAFDASHPLAPVPFASRRTQRPIAAIGGERDRLLLAVEGEVVSLSLPSLAEQGRRELGAAVRALAVNGDRTYVATRAVRGQPDFHVLDRELEPLGSARLLRDARALDVTRDLAYVATARGSLVFLDLSRDEPALLDEVDLAGPGSSLRVHNRLVYAGSHSRASVEIFDPRTHALPEISDVNGDGEIRVLCMGDSNTRLSIPEKWCEYLGSELGPGWRTFNQGHGGGSAYDFYWPPQDLVWFQNSPLPNLLYGLEVQPDVVVFAYGTNDVGRSLGRWPDVGLADIVEAYAGLAALADEMVPGVATLIALTPPSRVRAFDRVADEFAHNGGCMDLNDRLLRRFESDRLIDFYSPMVLPDDFVPTDSIHFNAIGQQKRARAALRRLRFGEPW